MFGTLARSYRFVLATTSEPFNIQELLHLAIERSNSLLLARFNR